MSDTVSTPDTVIAVPVVKSKGTVQVDVARIDEGYYRHALEAGLKVIVNAGASAVTPAKMPNESERLAKAQEIAEQRVADMYSGKLKLRGSSVGKAQSDTPAAVVTEARRIARDIIKAAMKKKGIKISGYKPSEITKLANDMLASAERDALIAQAEKNLAERGKLPVSIDTVDLSALPGANPTEKAPLSAAKAGQTEHRATH